MSRAEALQRADERSPEDVEEAKGCITKSTRKILLLFEVMVSQTY